MQCHSNRCVFKWRRNWSGPTAGSRKLSGREFQTVGPQWRKHERRKCCDGREERWVGRKKGQSQKWGGSEMGISETRQMTDKLELMTNRWCVLQATDICCYTDVHVQAIWTQTSWPVTVGLHVSVPLCVYMNCTLTSINWRLFHLPTMTMTCKLRYKWYCCNQHRLNGLFAITEILI